MCAHQYKESTCIECDMYKVARKNTRTHKCDESHRQLKVALTEVREKTDETQNECVVIFVSFYFIFFHIECMSRRRCAATPFTHPINSVSMLRSHEYKFLIMPYAMCVCTVYNSCVVRRT